MTPIAIHLVSPTTARALWIIAVALAGFLLALTLWGWARRGYTWTTFLCGDRRMPTQGVAFGAFRFNRLLPKYR